MASITKTTLTCLRRLVMTTITIETTANPVKMNRINIGMRRGALNQETKKWVINPCSSFYFQVNFFYFLYLLDDLSYKMSPARYQSNLNYNNYEDSINHGFYIFIFNC